MATTTTATKRPASSSSSCFDTTSPPAPPPPAPVQAPVQPPTKRQRRLVAESARQRAAKACQRCRRLKEKCDGQQPCQRCQRARRECEFSSPPPPPARADSRSQKEDGASSVTTTSSSSNSSRSEERVRCLETLVQHLLGDVPMDVNNLRRMAEKAASGGGQLRMDDLDDLTLEDENFTVKTLSQSTAHYSGEFSHWNFSQKLRRRLSHCLDGDLPIKRDLHPALHSTSNTTTHNSTAMAPPPPRRVLEYWRATQLQSPRTLIQSVLQGCLPPRPVAFFLADIYFAYAQVNCFYVEQGWLRTKLAFLYEAPGHVTSEDAGWVCSVLMVLAIGTQFAHMAEQEQQQQQQKGGEQEHDEQEKQHQDEGDDSDVGVTFYQMASKLIPDIIAIASMESVQACLLLAHYALPLDTHGLAYTYLGLGIKMAIQNGMHRRYTGTDLDARTIETRNRLWWTAYTVERRVSVLHGRPPSIAATEVDAELPKDLPEFRQYDNPSKFSHMSALIDMTLRLGDVANAITLLRRCPKNLQPTYFERIIDITQALQTWWTTSLPLSTRSPNPSSPLFRSAAHLNLSLYLTDIFIGRPFILSTAPSNPQHPSPARAALISRAVHAAQQTITLLHTLHSSIGLARSSYTEFSACRAALLVLLAQASVGAVAADNTDESEELVEVGMGLLRRMAAGTNVSTRSETSVLEALEGAVRRLRGAATTAAGTAGAGGVVGGVGKSGYERFREWASAEGVGGVGAGGFGMLGTMGMRVGGGNGVSGGGGGGGGDVEGVGGSSVNPYEQQYSPESARWLTLMDTTGSVGGISMEQVVDDGGLFGGFPELGALDGLPGMG